MYPRASGNLILTGFMGTGKTSVADELARRLGTDLIDMDALIEAREGLTIGQIFSQKGEAYFRQLEAKLSRELASRLDPSRVRGTQGAAGHRFATVIATGGGTLVPGDNRELFQAIGTVVCLTASLDDIERRLDSMQGRPLLDVARGPGQLGALLSERLEAYGQIPLQVDTTGLTVEQVADRVLAAADAPVHAQIPVRHPSGAYSVHIGWGLIDRIGELLQDVAEGGRVAVVTNPTVGVLYADQVAASLCDGGYCAVVHRVPDGEAFKNLDTVRALYDGFVRAGLDRHDTVLALGGGVVGDMAGYAAATYLRGVRLVQVPTTLLAAVDASIGGKVAVDHQQGKNLIGAFKQPAMVVIDPETLGSLSPAEFASGMAEVIKAGIIGDPTLFEQIEGYGSAPLLWLIERAVRVKVGIVALDPFERGLRIALNLGHTFGHALELASGYALSHGEAVSMGLVAASQLSARLGFCEQALADRVRDLLASTGLPTSVHGYSASQIVQAMETDKKRKGNRQRFVLIRKLGEVFSAGEVHPADVVCTLEEMGAPRC